MCEKGQALWEWIQILRELSAQSSALYRWSQLAYTPISTTDQNTCSPLQRVEPLTYLVRANYERPFSWLCPLVRDAIQTFDTCPAEWGSTHVL